jgi:hypothetical protein
MYRKKTCMTYNFIDSRKKKKKQVGILFRMVKFSMCYQNKSFTMLPLNPEKK